MMRYVRLGSMAVVLTLIGLAIVTAGVVGASSYYTPGSTGYDISWPQCSSRLPRDGSFGIVGVNYGLPWSENPCFAKQLTWAKSLPLGAAVYVNTANPGPQSQYWKLPGPKPCDGTASLSCAYNYGWNAAGQAFAVAVKATSSSGAASLYWWLDVETVNSWEGSLEANSQTIQGYLDYLQGRGVTGVGVYSTDYQWKVITGGYQLPAVANWVAGSSTAKTAPKYCNSSFTGGPVTLVQYYSKGFDANLVCGSGGTGSGSKPQN